MGLITFRGGIHPPENKSFTQSIQIKLPQPVEKVIIPLQQHTGAIGEPRIKAGEMVCEGDIIAVTEAHITATIHSSISGIVSSITPMPHPVLGESLAVVVEKDPAAPAPPDWYALSNGDFLKATPEEIIEAARAGGLVGMGGAAFPTHVKLSPRVKAASVVSFDKNASKTSENISPVETVIINGAECEPYLTSDDRLMQEEPQSIIKGAWLVARAVGAKELIIAIENNKPAATKIIADTISNLSLPDVKIKVLTLKTKYPQGSEKQLIKAITGKEVPSGGLPADVGVLVQNVGTCFALFEAVNFGKPLIERVVTVTGSAVNSPGNFRVKIGTPFSKMIEYAGGFKEEPAKILMGGPMMGIAQYSLDVPVIKGTTGIVCLTANEVDTPEIRECIRCGFCIRACPMNLMPTLISLYSRKGRYSTARDSYNLYDCIECGCCAYVCPAKIPIVQWIKLAKSKTRQL